MQTNVVFQEIQSRISDVAFLLGNGINYYKKGEPDAVSWNDLLEELSRNLPSDLSSNIMTSIGNKALSMGEVFDVISINQNPDELKTLKREIADIFRSKTPSDGHALLARKFQELQVPVLTTNYDKCLVDALSPVYRGKHKHVKAQFVEGGYSESYCYPFNCCYSSSSLRAEDVNSRYAVWPIHGSCDYVNSIRIGHRDYMNLTFRVKSIIDECFKDNDASKWSGRNTWLNPFLNKHLVIVGLGFARDETFLRWLIMERQKLNQKYNKGLTGWYFYQPAKGHPSKDLQLGLQILLESCGIQVVKMDFDSLINEVLSL